MDEIHSRTLFLSLYITCSPWDCDPDRPFKSHNTCVWSHGTRRKHSCCVIWNGGHNKDSPPPFWWHRYGNLQTLPSPTLNPTWARKYSTLLFHPARAAGSDGTSCISSPANPAVPESGAPVWSSSVGRGCFSIWEGTEEKGTGQNVNHCAETVADHPR